jgi:hypothetical protein
MRVNDLISIIRLAGIKRTVSEDEQGNFERQDAIAKLKKLTAPDPMGGGNHAYVDPKTGTIMYSGNAGGEGTPSPVGSAQQWNDPTNATASLGRDLKDLLKQAGLQVTADAKGNARVDPAAFANLGKAPTAAPTAAPIAAPTAAPTATTSAIQPPVVSPGLSTPTGNTSMAGAAAWRPPAAPNTNVSSRADYEGDVNPSSGGGKGAAPNFSQDANAKKKKVSAPVDPQLKTLQQGLLDTDSKYKELLGPFGADGRIGKYTRNALKQYVKDDPDEAKNPKLIPILTKYGIIPAAPTSGPQGVTGPTGAGAQGPASPTSGPAAPTSGPTSGPAAPTSGPAAPTSGPTSGPAAAPAAPAASASRPAGEVRKSIEAIASKYKVSESRLTPVGQIQKFRQLIDEADAEAPPKPTIRKLPGETTEDAIKRLRGEELKRLADKLKTDWNSADQDRYHQLSADQEKAIAAEKKATAKTEPAKTTTPTNAAEPAKTATPTNTAEPDPQGRKEPKLGNPTVQPPKAGTPVPGTPGYEFTGEVDAKGRPKARKIIVPPAAIEAEVAAAQQAGKLGLKQVGTRVLGMTTRIVSFAAGWRVMAALAAMQAISWMYDTAYENGTRVNISREDMVQLGKDKQALEALASNKNLTPEEQKEVAAAMEQMARLLANSETIDDVWAKVGIPGRSGAPKNK